MDPLYLRKLKIGVNENPLRQMNATPNEAKSSQAKASDGEVVVRNDEQNSQQPTNLRSQSEQLMRDLRDEMLAPKQLKMNYLASMERASYIKKVMNLPNTLPELLIQLQNPELAKDVHNVLMQPFPKPDTQMDEGNINHDANGGTPNKPSAERAQSVIGADEGFKDVLTRESEYKQAVMQHYNNAQNAGNVKLPNQGVVLNNMAEPQAMQQPAQGVNNASEQQVVQQPVTPQVVNNAAEPQVVQQPVTPQVANNAAEPPVVQQPVVQPQVVNNSVETPVVQQPVVQPQGVNDSVETPIVQQPVANNAQPPVQQPAPVTNAPQQPVVQPQVINNSVETPIVQQPVANNTQPPVQQTAPVVNTPQQPVVQPQVVNNSVETPVVQQNVVQPQVVNNTVEPQVVQQPVVNNIPQPVQQPVPQTPSIQPQPQMINNDVDPSMVKPHPVQPQPVHPQQARVLPPGPPRPMPFVPPGPPGIPPVIDNNIPPNIGPKDEIIDNRIPKDYRPIDMRVRPDMNQHIIDARIAMNVPSPLDNKIAAEQMLMRNQMHMHDKVQEHHHRHHHHGDEPFPPPPKPPVDKSMEAAANLYANLSMNDMQNPTLTQMRQRLSDDAIELLFTGLINLKDLSKTLKTNGHDARSKLIVAMATASRQGIDNSQLSSTLKMVSQSMAAEENNPAQILKNMIALYLPWYPLQEGVGFNLSIETVPNQSDFDSLLKVYIQTRNYGNVNGSLVLLSGNAVDMNIQCNDHFPKDDLLDRMQDVTDNHSIRSNITVEERAQMANEMANQQASVNMSSTYELNPFLLLMAHSFIKNTIIIDSGASA